MVGGAKGFYTLGVLKEVETLIGRLSMVKAATLSCRPYNRPDG